MKVNPIDEKLVLKAGDKTPDRGFIIFKDIATDKLKYRHLWGTHKLQEGEIYAESLEEACALAGEPFYPYGAVAFSKVTLDEIQKREKRIISCTSKIDSSFWTIAFDLHWMNEKKAWASKSCFDLVDYSEKMFGYGKTTCYSLIAIVDRFAKRNEDGSIIEAPSDLAKDYSVSKLELMVNLTDDQINQLKPTMSVREIKKFIKGFEKDNLALPDKSSGDSDEGIKELDKPEEPPSDSKDSSVIDSTAEVVNRNVLVSYNGSADYEKKKTKIDSSISRILKKHPDALIEISYTLP